MTPDGQAPRRRAHARRVSPLARSLRWAERICGVVVLLCALVLVAVVAGPRFFPYQALVVRSGSMAPTMPIGSIVFYHRESAAAVHVGQVILFDEPGNPSVRVTHRVHEIVHSAGGTYFVTKGDANAVADNWRVRASGTGWVASFAVPEIGYPFAFLSTAWARLLLVSVPALLLAVLLLVEQLPPGRRRRRQAVSP